MKKKNRVVIAYMDKIDFVEELGKASDGKKVFKSIEDLDKNKPCAKECGIVEVEIRLKRIVRETDYSQRKRKQK